MNPVNWNVPRVDIDGLTNMDNLKTIDLFAKPQRDEKGHFIKGNTMTPIGKVGRHCEFCPNAKEILKKVTLYRHYCNGKVNGKKRVPFLEELCDEDYLDILVDQLEDWCKTTEIKEHDSVHNPSLHTELSRSVALIFNNQRLWLKKRLLSDKNPTGAIFLLKANHGMMETEKRILAGDPEKPVNQKLEIEITEAKKHE